MPEPRLRPFVVMMPRLIAEETRRMMDALIAANGRQLKDAAYREVSAALDRRIDGDEQMRRRVPSSPRKLMSLNQLAGIDNMRVVRENRVAASPITSTKPGERPGLIARQQAEQEGR